LTTEDGSESVTATVCQLVRFNMENGVGRAIVIAYIHTDSTGRLAPLEGMILTGIDELTQTEAVCSPCGNGKVGYHYRLLLLEDLSNEHNNDKCYC
jgi:hypothetical protein